MDDRTVMAVGLLILSTLAALSLAPRMSEILDGVDAGDARVDRDSTEDLPGVAAPVEAAASATGSGVFAPGRPAADRAALRGGAAWGRDPFRPRPSALAAGVGQAAAPDSDTVVIAASPATDVDGGAIPDWRLTAILGGADADRRAIVDRRVLREGDTTRGWTVREIRGDAVVFQRAGRTVVVRLAGTRAPAR